MPPEEMTYTCSASALDEFIQFCRARQYKKFMLICDVNTYAVLGERVEKILHAQDWQVRTVMLQGEEVIADEEYLIQVLMQANAEPCTYLAVGSGTITDITRFCSHRTGNPFISLPTAPSVDGFASLIAPVVIRLFKETAYAQAPVAIFADIQTLCEAPQDMIAAGFGDMLGKYTALADWRISHLLGGEPYNPVIADRTRRALKLCVNNADEIRKASPAGMVNLMDGLVESGICMVLNGNSRPASGAEHHLSHFWEMKLLQEGRPAVLHGAKVGIGTLHIARQYEQIRGLSREQVVILLEKSTLPDRQDEIQKIRSAFGPISANIEREQQRFLDMTAEVFTALKADIASQWDSILEIAESVPSSADILALLNQVEAPTDITQLGMQTKEEAEALQYGHYLRSQFTVAKLGRVLGLW
jgi:glycerol-1-phosphate dehydrogenase [NAD(P)+]